MKVLDEDLAVGDAGLLQRQIHIPVRLGGDVLLQYGRRRIFRAHHQHLHGGKRHRRDEPIRCGRIRCRDTVQTVLREKTAELCRERRRPQRVPGGRLRHADRHRDRDNQLAQHEPSFIAFWRSRALATARDRRGYRRGVDECPAERNSATRSANRPTTIITLPVSAAAATRVQAKARSTNLGVIIFLPHDAPAVCYLKTRTTASSRRHEHRIRSAWNGGDISAGDISPE